MTQPFATRRLGKSDIELTILGMGGAPLGDLFARLDDVECLETIRLAYREGIRYFDTAPFYGRGLSEIRMGLGLQGFPRGDYKFSTKVGRITYPDPTIGPDDKGDWAGGLDVGLTADYTADATKRSIEQSLLRMGKSRIDVALIHDVDVWTHGSQEAYEVRYAEAMKGAYPVLADLRSQGVIGAIGAGINESDVATRFIKDGDFDCIMLAGRYTLLEQGALDDYFPEAEKRGVGTLLAGAFNSGVLATGLGENAKYNYKNVPAELHERVTALARVCAAHNVPLQQAAIQFPLGHPTVTTVVVGMVKQSEVTSNVAAMQAETPVALWSDLKSEGLVRQDAPTPS